MTLRNREAPLLKVNWNQAREMRLGGGKQDDRIVPWVVYQHLEDATSFWRVVM